MNKEIIVERYKNPKNWSKELNGLKGQSINQACGDEVFMSVDVDKGVIKSAKYNGNGCSICLATTDLLIDSIIGKSASEILKISEEEVMQLIAMDAESPRKRCATLSLEAVRNTINSVE